MGMNCPNIVLSACLSYVDMSVRVSGSTRPERVAPRPHRGGRQRDARLRTRPASGAARQAPAALAPAGTTFVCARAARNSRLRHSTHSRIVGP